MLFVKVPSGDLNMISDDNPRILDTKENININVPIRGFEITDTPITNKDFATFVNATGYKTDAERYGNSFVIKFLVDDDDLKFARSIPELPWWQIVEGADWQHPYGPNSNIDNLEDYPVIHVSRNDAVAYCQWSNTRLPTEAEWEYAARGNSENALRPWGNYLHKGNKYFANYWQGTGKRKSTLMYEDGIAKDGYLGLAPVRAFQPNAFGLYQVIGNVWEWCSNKLNVSLNFFKNHSPQSIWNENLEPRDDKYATRGGSFLCVHPRLRIRDGDGADSGSSNLGFRVVKDIK